MYGYLGDQGDEIIGTLLVHNICTASYLFDGII